MTEQITPPPELVQQWLSEFYGSPTAPGESTLHVANRAGQWCADQELEACCGWLVLNGYGDAASRLRAARRTKPPSLKEQALEALSEMEDECLMVTHSATIRRALEALPDD